MKANVSMNIIEQVQAWYASKCDGDWEHQYGIKIDTLDNPGWIVTIDLKGTHLEDAIRTCYKRDNGNDDWVVCEIKEGKFIGHGDPLKLGFILEIFIKEVSG